MLRFSTVLFFVVFCMGAVVPEPLLHASPVEIKEWDVPWQRTRPRDPFVDGLGKVWFVGQVGNYVAMLDPHTAEFRRFDLEKGTGPHNLIVDKGNFVWYAGNRQAYIGKLDPKSGEVTKYPMPDPAARDPHTLAFDRNGDIWFTVQQSNFVGKLAVRTGDIRLIRVPTPAARPYGIVVDRQNRPWVNLFGTNKIATIDPRSFELKEYTLPHPEARSRRIDVTSDGRVWYVDHARGFLGRLDPASGKVDEWQVPGGANARPYAMAADDRDRLWFVETGSDPNRFVGFDPESSKFFGSAEIPSGGTSVRHMVFHRPSRQIWFGTDRNTIGRALVSKN